MPYDCAIGSTDAKRDSSLWSVYHHITSIVCSAWLKFIAMVEEHKLLVEINEMK